VGLRLASRGMRDVAALSWVGSYDCVVLGIGCALLVLYWLRDLPTLSPPSPPPHEEEEEEERKCSYLWNKIRHAFRPKNQHPIGIYLFLIGALFAVVELSTTQNINNQYDLPLTFFGAPIAVWALEGVSLQDWKVGLLEGAIPQIPLTTLNSVISVCCLAHSLYPEKRNITRKTTKTTTDGVISRREVSMSVGLMNIIFCPFGSMPNCHGAGGLAAQHRLGARHGASVVFLGVAKVLLAVFFGKSALTLLDALPMAVLGVMLSIAGMELTSTGFTLLVKQVKEDADTSFFSSDSLEITKEEEEQRKKQHNQLFVETLRKKTVVAVITAAVIVALGKTHYGAVSGWIAHMIYGDGFVDFRNWIGKKRRKREKEEEGKDIGSQKDLVV